MHIQRQFVCPDLPDPFIRLLGVPQSPSEPFPSLPTHCMNGSREFKRQMNSPQALEGRTPEGSQLHFRGYFLANPRNALLLKHLPLLARGKTRTVSRKAEKHTPSAPAQSPGSIQSCAEPAGTKCLRGDGGKQAWLGRSK